MLMNASNASGHETTLTADSFQTKHCEIPLVTINESTNTRARGAQHNFYAFHDQL